MQARRRKEKKRKKVRPVKQNAVLPLTNIQTHTLKSKEKINLNIPLDGDDEAPLCRALLAEENHVEEPPKDLKEQKRGRLEH